jgi:hypothetical protein
MTSKISKHCHPTAMAWLRLAATKGHLLLATIKNLCTKMTCNHQVTFLGALWSLKIGRHIMKLDLDPQLFYQQTYLR